MKQALIPLKSTKPTSNLNDETIKIFSHTKNIFAVVRDYQALRLNEKNLLKSLKKYPKTSNLANFQTHHTKSSPPIQYIKDLMRIGEAQKSAKRFSCSFCYPSFFQKLYFFSKLRKFTSLSFLELVFCTSFNCDVSTEIFIRRLGSLKNLSHFSIRFSDGNFQNLTTLHRLFRCLFSLKKLTSLTLEFAICKKFKSAQLDVLSAYLKKFSKLHALDLHFILLKDLDDTAIFHLASALSNLRALTQFSLYLGEVDTESKYTQKRVIENPSTLLQFFKSFRQLNVLSNLDINVAGCRIWAKSHNDLIVEGLSYLQNLPIKKLKLFPYCNFSDQNIADTFRILKKFRSLTALYFGFDECSEITPQGIFKFSRLLSEFLSLSSLQLSLNFFTNAVKESLQDVASGIRHLKNLTELCLWVSGPHSTGYTQMKKLSSSLSNLHSLKDLSLSFDFQEHLADFAMVDLSQCLKNLTLLEGLSLSFEKTVELTNLGIECLAGAISKLKNLKSLYLDFGYNNEMDEGSVEDIGQSLLSLPCLEDVSLIFSGCYLIVETKGILLNLFRAITEKKKSCKVFLRPESAFNE